MDAFRNYLAIAQRDELQRRSKRRAQQREAVLIRRSRKRTPR